MAVPPSYSDLGKAAKDLLNKGYNYGSAKLELKTKTENGIAVTAGGSSNLASGKIAGNLETKWACKDSGLNVTKKWNTDNVVSSEVSVEDKLVKGLKLTLDSTLAVPTGSKSGAIKAAFKKDYVNIALDANLAKAPVINGAAVVGYQGVLLGYQMAFDVGSSKLAKSNFALGYSAGNLTLHTAVNNGSEFAGSLHQKHSDSLETAVNVSYASGATPAFAVAAKKNIDKDLSLQAKVNNAAQLGVAYSQVVKPGLKLTLSSMVDVKNFSAGGHQLGLGLEFAA
jgi:hypothetical protein